MGHTSIEHLNMCCCYIEEKCNEKFYIVTKKALLIAKLRVEVHISASRWLRIVITTVVIIY